MKASPVVLAILLMAQPAAATRIVELAPADCIDGGTACAQPAAQPQGDTGANAGPLIAGLVGLLVLGLVFGRRKPGLPQVVS
jgi:MYXO-CTERM domain-containing protein